MTAPAETRTNEATMTAIVAVSTVEAFSTDFSTPSGSVCSDLVSDFLVDFFSSPVETGVSSGSDGAWDAASLRKEIAALTKRMKKCAENLEFEDAAAIRDTINKMQDDLLLLE